MKDDLIKCISKQRELTHAIILTHNMDFLFFELFLLKTLSKCGAPSITILASAPEALSAFKNVGQFLTGLGRRYRVIPVLLPNKMRFHPKAVFLAGKTKATLFIGSGNLTFGGYRDNFELWQRFDSDDFGLSTIMQFKKYLNTLSDLTSMRELFYRDVDNAYDESTHTWAKESDTPGHLLFSRNGDETLLSRMASHLEGQQIKRLVVCAPFYDAKASALTEIVKAMRVPKTELWIQPRFTNLPEDARSDLPASTAIEGVTANTADGRERFIHAKIYAFETDEEFILICGSANCSRAALTLPRKYANTELLVTRNLPRELFESSIRGELVFSGASPVLASTQELEENDEDSIGQLTALAASYELGKIFVEFRGPKDVEIEKCDVDGSDHACKHLTDGVAVIECSFKPHRLKLKGICCGEPVVSNLLWISDEFDLGCSSTERILAESLQKATKTDTWNPDAYAEILKYLRQTMAYLPATGSMSNRKAGKIERTPTPFTLEDLVVSRVDLPKGITPSLAAGDWRSIGIKRLLMEWFGFAADEETQEEANEPEETLEPQVETVDKMESALPKPPMSKSNPITEKAKKRISRVLVEIEGLVSCESYIYNRPLDRIGLDLCITGFLALLGRGEGWLTPEEYFDFSAGIWIAAFSNCGLAIGLNTTIGYLPLAYKTEPNQDLFLQKVATPDTAAILTAWLLTIPIGLDKPQKGLLHLAGLKAVAEMPSILHIEKPTELGPRVRQILEMTKNIGSRIEDEWSGIEDRWNRLITQGRMLTMIETVLNRYTMADLRELITEETVNQGDLLWQPSFGICVSAITCKRSSGVAADVYSLFDKTKTKRLRSEYLLPLKQTLELVAVKQQLPSNIIEEATNLLSDLAGKEINEDKPIM